MVELFVERLASWNWAVDKHELLSKLCVLLINFSEIFPTTAFMERDLSLLGGYRRRRHLLKLEGRSRGLINLDEGALQIWPRRIQSHRSVSSCPPWWTIMKCFWAVHVLIIYLIGISTLLYVHKLREQLEIILISLQFVC